MLLCIVSIFTILDHHGRPAHQLAAEVVYTVVMACTVKFWANSRPYGDRLLNYSLSTAARQSGNRTVVKQIEE